MGLTTEAQFLPYLYTFWNTFAPLSLCERAEGTSFHAFVLLRYPLLLLLLRTFFLLAGEDGFFHGRKEGEGGTAIWRRKDMYHT